MRMPLMVHFLVHSLLLLPKCSFLWKVKTVPSVNKAFWD